MGRNLRAGREAAEARALLRPLEHLHVSDRHRDVPHRRGGEAVRWPSRTPAERVVKATVVARIHGKIDRDLNVIVFPLASRKMVKHQQILYSVSIAT
jgi:hypothetical protein